MSDLRKLASEANKPRVRCEGQTCSCNDYARKMQAFREVATPERILQMLADSADQSTKIGVADDALQFYLEDTCDGGKRAENALETLRGK